MIMCRSATVRLLHYFSVSAILAGALVAPAYAERPPASQLLPENTIFIVSVTNAQDLATRFMNTDLGRMTQDPEMKPFVTQLYASLTELVATVQDQIGLSLPEIVAIPQGEATFAFVSIKDGPPSMVMLLDAGDKIANARKLFDRWMEAMLGKDGVSAKREETIDKIKINIFDNAGPNRRALVVFEKDGTIVVGDNLDILKGILATWNGQKNKTLADNFNFGAIMNRCKGDKDEQPQIICFFDPINLMRSAAEQFPPMRITVALLPVLGLDGLSAVGGSVLFDAGQYDTVIHAHVLLENPRSGIIKMIALEPGVSKPERWVPPDVASYNTVHWKFDTTIKTLTPMYDSIAGEGAFSQMIQQRFSTPLGVDLEKQILPKLEGRVTYITSFEKPTTPASGMTLVALKFKDTESINKAIESLVKRFQEQISKQKCAGKEYYRIDIPVPPPPPPPAQGPDPSQIPIPCFGIVDDYLVISNRPGLYEKVLTTLADGSKSLADEPEFKLIANKIQRQSGGAQPVVLGFQRPEEAMRYYYDLAVADRTREALKKEAERNPFFKSIDSSLQKTPLPPFEVIQRYLALSGSMITDDDTGLHYMNFSLRRKSD